MSRGLSDLHYTYPWLRFHQLMKLAQLPPFQFDIVCTVEARKFGLRQTELRRLVKRVQEMTPDEIAREKSALEKLDERLT